MVDLSLSVLRRVLSVVFPDIRKLAPKEIKLIEPSDRSPEGFTVPEIVIRYGHLGKHPRNAVPVVPHFLRALYYSTRCYRSVKRSLPDPKGKADEGFLRELEGYARELGCSKVGYTEVPRDYIFRGAALLFRNAIVLTMEMDKDEIGKAPQIAAGKEIGRTYADLGEASYRLAEFLKKRGYNAQPDPPIGGHLHFAILAQKAGLGYIGKSGLLISEGSGPSQRIAAVYTDIELPFTDSREKLYKWIPRFCDFCNRCVLKCPAKAIYPEPKVLQDGRKQYVDYRKCAVPFSETMGCSICVKECAFFKADFYRIRKAYERLAEEQRDAGEPRRFLNPSFSPTLFKDPSP